MSASPEPSAIAALFSETLGFPCGVDDNFFDLGGDSLAAETVMTGLAAALGRDLPVALLLDYPTPRSLAGHLAAA